MSKHPGLYFEIGKKARDLLYKEYTQQPPVHDHYDCQPPEWNFDISCEDIAPGLKTVFKFLVPNSNGVEVQYLNDHAGITAGIGLRLKPILNFSGVIGGSVLNIGTELGFDTATGTFTRCNAGLNFNSDFLIASLTLNDMGQTVRASCYHNFNSLTKTAVAAEWAHSFSGKYNYLTIGAQHLLSPATLVKVRVSTFGKMGIIFQQELLPKVFVTMAAEMQTRASMRGAKIRLSMGLRP